MDGQEKPESSGICVDFERNHVGVRVVNAHKATRLDRNVGMSDFCMIWCSSATVRVSRWMVARFHSFSKAIVMVFGLNVPLWQTIQLRVDMDRQHILRKA